MLRHCVPRGATGCRIGGTMNETTITIAGNLVSDVDFRTTARGDGLARFRVAATAQRYDRASGRWTDGDTAYWNVTAWRRAAENARDSLAKGHPVVVHGRVRQRTVDRQVADAPGVTMSVTYTDLEATHFGLDLSRCRAIFQRAPIGPQTQPGSTVPAGYGGEPAADGGVATADGGVAAAMDVGREVPAADAAAPAGRDEAA